MGASRHTRGEAQGILERHTGVVIPVYFATVPPKTEARELLEDTLHAYVDQAGDPASVCLSVDGEEHGKEIAEALAASTGASIVVAERNRGKFQAAMLGARTLLKNETMRYIAVVDQDGDHFANELLNFIRMAKHIGAETGIERIIVLGRRISKHHPMGFLRGELEELADRVLQDMLHYRAATAGRPLDLRYATLLEEFPDFHSGYKVYSRATAHDIFDTDPDAAGLPEDAGLRHGCEVIPLVEGLEMGAVLGVVNRSTFNEQPVTVFGGLDRIRLIADKILWPARRLEIPPAFVLQWMRNHIPRLLLTTLAPEGREEVMQILEMVRETLTGHTEPPDGDSPGGPLFL